MTIHHYTTYLYTVTYILYEVQQQQRQQHEQQPLHEQQQQQQQQLQQWLQQQQQQQQLQQQQERQVHVHLISIRFKNFVILCSSIVAREVVRLFYISIKRSRVLVSNLGLFFLR